MTSHFSRLFMLKALVFAALFTISIPSAMAGDIPGGSSAPGSTVSGNTPSWGQSPGEASSVNTGNAPGDTQNNSSATPGNSTAPGNGSGYPGNGVPGSTPLLGNAPGSVAAYGTAPGSGTTGPGTVTPLGQVYK